MIIGSLHHVDWEFRLDNIPRFEPFHAASYATSTVLDIPVARLSRVRRENDIDALIAEIRAQRAGRQPTTQDEIRAWRDEGRRY